MREIAIRGFINEKFNTTFGKGLFRRAVFNGSVELRNPNTKYLVDFYYYAEWEAQAKTDEQMDVIRKLAGTEFANTEGLLFSWILHYDPLTKAKIKINGYAIYSPDTQELYINIDDAAHATVEEWTLPAHPCKSTGANKPIFVATNIDLNSWH